MRHTQPNVTVSCPRHFASVLPFPPCSAFKQAKVGFLLGNYTVFVLVYNNSCSRFGANLFDIHIHNNKQLSFTYSTSNPTASKRLLPFYSNLYFFLHIHPFYTSAESMRPTLLLASVGVVAASVAQSYDYGVDLDQLVRRQDPTDKIIVGRLPLAPNGSIPIRPEIHDMRKDGYMWDLYILALSMFQSVSQDSPLSWYQIAGRTSPLPILPCIFCIC